MNYKKIGVNWTGIRDLESLEFMTSNGHIDFIEILIDNFLNCEPKSILDTIKDIPCAFHIMNSRFIDNDISNLSSMAKSINFLKKELNPIYVSDHLGKFYYKEFTLPQMLEVDYQNDSKKIFEKLSIWQDLLECEIFLENYPSIFRQPVGQAEFFEHLINATNCGLLFDISNAIISESNTGYAISSWDKIAKSTSHFHIAGYAPCGIENEFLVDTHDCEISDVGLKWTEHFLRTTTSNKITISVERDGNFNNSEWLSDIQRVREVI
ncbi:MAG: DUF692 family protein [Moraxella sp.]|nr:DUF692 family protein [Moraxella sp.]